MSLPDWSRAPKQIVAATRNHDEALDAVDAAADRVREARAALQQAPPIDRAGGEQRIAAQAEHDAAQRELDVAQKAAGAEERVLIGLVRAAADAWAEDVAGDLETAIVEVERAAGDLEMSLWRVDCLRGLLTSLEQPEMIRVAREILHGPEDGRRPAAIVSNNRGEIVAYLVEQARSARPAARAEALARRFADSKTVRRYIEQLQTADTYTAVHALARAMTGTEVS